MSYKYVSQFVIFFFKWWGLFLSGKALNFFLYCWIYWYFLHGFWIWGHSLKALYTVVMKNYLIYSFTIFIDLYLKIWCIWNTEWYMNPTLIFPDSYLAAPPLFIVQFSPLIWYLCIFLDLIFYSTGSYIHVPVLCCFHNWTLENIFISSNLPILISLSEFPL